MIQGIYNRILLRESRRNGASSLQGCKHYSRFGESAIDLEVELVHSSLI